MNKIKLYFTLLLALPFLAGSTVATAQVKVHVVTKKVTKSVPWKPGMSLLLTGERAKVYCSAHANSTIDFEIEIIAENEDKKRAETDLNKMKWIDKVSGKKLFLRNYVELTPGETKPQSDLKVVYHLKVPEGCDVTINNYFGKIDVNNTSASLTINSKFSPVNLENTSGTLSVNSFLGNIRAHKVNGSILFKTDQSDINITGLSGSLNIQSNLANISISDIDNLQEAGIQADKSNLILETGNYAVFSFLLHLTNSQLGKPDAMTFKFTQQKKGETDARFNTETDYPQFNINLNTSTLTIVN